MSYSRRSNRKDHWVSTLQPYLNRIQLTISEQIDKPAGHLEHGAAVLAAELYMLDRIAKTDPDDMIYATFIDAVEDNIPRPMKQRDWWFKLVFYVRGGKKRTQIQNDALAHVPYVLGYLLKYWEPGTDEPDETSVLEFIETHPPTSPGQPGGFNGVRLAWDNREEEEEIKREKRAQEKLNREDLETARLSGFDTGDAAKDLMDYRNHRFNKEREERLLATAMRTNEEMAETTKMLIAASEIVDAPGKDGEYYFWAADPQNATLEHWYRLKPTIRQRMIKQGGRAADTVRR